MKGIKTKHFLRSFFASVGVCVIFLGWLCTFGKDLAVRYFDGVMGCLLALMGVATLSFVAFCFVPYFHGDKRWFAIPSLLTVVFFIGTAVLWHVPIEGIGG